jgi:hypothetical protein
LEGSERSWELYLNDALKNARGVRFTGSSQHRNLGFHSDLLQQNSMLPFEHRSDQAGHL